MNNLIGNPAYTELAENLKRQMYEKMASIHDTFENNTWYEKNWTKDRIILRTATLHGGEQILNQKEKETPT